MMFNIKPSECRRILVVRRDNVGDLVCTTPLFEGIRTHCPNLQIAALVNSYNHDVLRNNPNIDKIFVYQKTKHAIGVFGIFKAIIDRVALILAIRKWSPEIIILAKGSYDKHGLNFARMIGDAKVIGFVPESRVHQGKMLPDIRLDAPRSDSMHEVESLNLLLSPLGIDDALGPLKVWPEASSTERIKGRLPNAKFRIAIHLSAREEE